MRTGSGACFGMVRAIGTLGVWSGDASRHARERQHPVDYLRHTYYENWLAGLEKMLVEKGLVSAEELATGVSAGLAAAQIRQRRLGVPDIDRAIFRSPVSVPLSEPPRFQVGERVARAQQSSAGPHARTSLCARPGGRHP